MERAIEHRCLPRPAYSCPHCGDSVPAPQFCKVCGADISPVHQCLPRPLPHVCPPAPLRGRCLACGEPPPTPRFCVTCGADITPSHRCKAAPPTQVPRPDPLHICPALKLDRCPHCGELLPGRTYCAQCGMDITPPHVCRPVSQVHICPPYLTMPRRCSHCGETLPAPKHCAQCGADITPEHVCTDWSGA